jgi:putative nucleotidyltransferase with HDIG domain
LEQYKSQRQEVEVADEGVLLDVDTPSDYQMMLSRYQRYGIPTVQECVALLRKKFAANNALFNHCLKVARVSLQIGKALNQSYCQFNLDLIVAAGLLHDLAKGKPDHARVGAEILRELGYHGVADVVSVHHDIFVQDDAPLTASEIVYLADKMVNGDKLVSVETRFQEKMDRFTHDSQARAAITARLAQTLTIKKRAENILEKPLETNVPNQFPNRMRPER